MIGPDFGIAFSASVVAAIVLLALAATPSPALAAGVPPFCVARGGGVEGGGAPQDCRYFDYQSCVQAATARGNCVQNIDYHGEVSTAPAPARARHRR